MFLHGVFKTLKYSILHIFIFTASPQAEVVWMRDTEVLTKNSKKLHYLEEGNIHTLVLNSFSEKEAGTYVCRAKNIYGSVDTTANIEIVSSSNMMGRPAIFVTRPDTRLTVAIGEDITFTFRVSGDPRPQGIILKVTTELLNALIQKSLR